MWQKKLLENETKGKPICVIPCRKGSKRLKGKNKLPLAGKPMFMYAVEAALESKIFQQIIVSTNDPEIIRLTYDKRVKKEDKNVNLMINYRPRMLCQDNVQMKDVCLFLLRTYRFSDVFCLLSPNNPFVTGDEVKECYELLFKKNANYVMSVKRCQPPPQWAMTKKHYLEPFMGHEYLQQTQKLDPLYVADGGIIMARSGAFLTEFDKDFRGSRCYPYFLKQSLDIDNCADYQYAKFLMNKRKVSDRLSNDGWWSCGGDIT